MRKTWRQVATALSLIGLLTPAASAWNDTGHMAVACAAYEQLTPNTRQRVWELLKKNPYFQRWQAQLNPDISENDRERDTFMLAATWPDTIKGDPSYVSDGSEGGNKGEGSTATQNIGYKDKLRHKYWHYVDVPYVVDSTAPVPLPTPNAQTQIAAFRKTLASDASDDIKAYDLVWLMHMIGDVHQPLHCVTRVSKDTPRGDNGGNDVVLKDYPKPAELHAFWDDLLGHDSQPETVAKMVKRLPPPDPSLAKVSDESVWIDESYQDAKAHAYIPPIGSGNGPFILTHPYKRAAAILGKQRVSLAGTRLASLLNTELK